jgi:glutamyl-tRNA reductase
LLKQALHHLEQGGNPEDIIKRLANQLTNKLIHTPTATLHKAGLEGNTPLIESAQKLLIYPTH